MPALQFGGAVERRRRHGAADGEAGRSSIGTGGEAVGTFGVFVRNLVFYTGVKTIDVITDEQAQDFWRSRLAR